MLPSAARMMTIPARFAQTASVSRDLAHAQSRAKALYRAWYRSAPQVCELYVLDIPPSKIRAKIRTRFEANKNIKDLAVLDVLLHKEQVEFQETLNAWKQTPHIMRWFKEEETPAQPKTFLDRFYSSRDEGRGTIGQGF